MSDPRPLTATIVDESGETLFSVSLTFADGMALANLKDDTTLHIRSRRSRRWKNQSRKGNT